MHNDHSDDCDSRADDIPVYACQVDVHRHNHADEDEDDADGFELVYHGVSFPVVGGSRSPRPVNRSVVEASDFRNLLDVEEILLCPRDIFVVNVSGAVTEMAVVLDY